MTKHHTTIIKQLTDLVPPVPVKVDALQMLRDE